MDYHQRAVATISAGVRRFHQQKQSFRIYHGATNSTRKTSFQGNRIVDTSELSHILSVDKATKTALVEPNVSMGLLVEATIKHGLMPPVVPEFPGITAGGAFSGTAGESSSFRYGFFDNTVNWIEIVLANGEVITASKIQYSDIFYGAAGSFGTLGVVTNIEIQLIDAKPFVEVTYSPVYSILDAIQQIEAASQDLNNEFVDAIQFNEGQGLVMTGHLIQSPEPGTVVQRFSRGKDPWFYLHAEKCLVRSNPRKEAIPLVDYLFRYDRGAFWAAKPVLTYIAVPFNDFTRSVVDPLMHTKTLYHGLHENGMAKDNIIQDLALPVSQAPNFLNWLNKEFEIYPLWLCPILRNEQKNMNPHAQEMLISIGVWGPRLPNPACFVAENRKLERKVREVGGFKWLYAHCHYTEAEFWEIYDKEWYDALRAKYHATYLPSVYDKIKFDWDAERRAIEGSWLRWLFSFIWWIWPVPGIYGVIRVLMQSNYLLNN